MSITVNKSGPVSVWVVLHAYRTWNTIIDVAGPFSTKEEAREYVEDAFKHDPGLSYKDAFYVKEAVLEDHNPDYRRATRTNRAARQRRATGDTIED